MILIIYMVLGYLAVPHTIWANKYILGQGTSIFVQRVIWGTVLGWALIPWWIVKIIIGHR